MGREEAQEKRRQLAGKMEQAIADVRDSERFKEWLTFCGRFHNYSMGNTMLIMLQSPNASRVAGFQTWKGMGRTVRKGEKGIAILAPQTFKRECNHEKDCDCETALGFRTVYVFDESQTDGDPLPDIAESFDGIDDAGLFGKLDNLAHAEGLTIDRLDPPIGAGAANGAYMHSARRIWLDPELGALQATKTLAHELAHHYAQHETNGHCREGREIIAESAAYIILQHFGLDAGSYSFDYLASWSANDPKAFKANLSETLRTASSIIEALEKPS